MPIESATVRGIRFVGLQDGPSERRFTEAVTSVLRTTVQRAYLARVEYQGNPHAGVALCLRSAESQESLVAAVGAIFSRMFGRDQHLDIVFLTDDQENELARVCDPFFEAEDDEA